MSMFFFNRTPVMRSIFPGLFSAKTDTWWGMSSSF